MGGTSGDPARREEADWFHRHYDGVPREILEFLAGDRLSLAGRRVADVGSGDGTIDLGLAGRAKPSYLAGFDIARTDEHALLHAARAAGVADELPHNLEFFGCEDDWIPADDASFDFVVTWSTFEHVKDPTATAAEICRILRPDGALFLQLYPFYRSAHGSHLWTWFPDGFAQLRLEPEAIEARVRTEPERSSPEWARARLADFRSLNRLTLDGLQDALTAGGLTVTKVELLTGPLHLPLDLAEHRIVDLAVSGIKLLACPTAQLTPAGPTGVG